VATADYMAVDGQQGSCLSEGDELDQRRGYCSGELKKTD